MVTVRGSAESIESRLLAGVLRCPCGGRLGPWGHARRRLVAMARAVREFWPRRSRCRSCGRTHVLLPADLWSRRRYGAAVIMAVLVLAARAGGGAAARPFAAGAGGDRAGAGVDGEVVAVAVLLACGGPAGAAGEAAPAGVGEGGRPAGGAVGIGGRRLPGRAGGGDGRDRRAVPGAGRGVGARGGRAPVRGPVAGAAGAVPGVQHDLA